MVKFYQRLIEGKLREALRYFPSVLLLGARRVGKSTIARRMRKNYITFDDLSALEFARSDPEGFIRSIEKPVVIDEIQRVPEILLPIKRDIDENPQPGRYLLTGSANISLRRELLEALVGRTTIIEMHPLSAVEITGSLFNIVDALFDGNVEAFRGGGDPNTLLKQIHRGFYPEVQFIPHHLVKQWLASYVSLYLERDVLELYQLRDMDGFRRLLRLLAHRSGNLLRKSELATESGLSIKTLNHYLELLSMVFQVYLLPPFHSNVGTLVRKAPKVYITDSGLLCYLLNLSDWRELLPSPYLGPVVETFVFSELLKHTSLSGDEIFFYRTGNGTEIDFVIRRGNDLVAVEVKATSTIRKRDARGIKAFARKHPEFRYGYVFYLGDRAGSLGDNVFAIPIGGLLSD